MTTPYAPSFLSPAAPGVLSNTHGGNTGADAISLQTLYRNPNTGAAPGLIRYRATRSSGGQTGQLVWDSWWCGSNGNQQALPDTLKVHGPTCVAQWGGRVYVAVDAGSGAGLVAGGIYSNTLNGPSLGSTWRQEQSNFQGQTAFSKIFSMVAVGGYLYLVCSIPPATFTAVLAYALINADGTLGLWQLLGMTGISQVIGTVDFLLGGYTDLSGVSYLTLFQQQTGGGNSHLAWGVTLAADGSIGTNAWVAQFGAYANIHAQGGVVIVPQAGDGTTVTLYLIAGYATANGTAGGATIEHATVTKGVPTSAWTLDTGLPAARGGFGLAIANGFVYVCGGNDGTSTAQATVYYAAFTTAGLSGAWNTATNALVAAGVAFGAAGQAVTGNTASPTTTGSLPAEGDPSVIVFGNGVVTVYGQWMNANGGNTTAAWFTASAVAMVVGNLGTGGALAQNADGSWNITMLWGAIDPYSYAGNSVPVLSNGDVVTLYVYVVDQNGDPSVAAVTAFYIGQPPTIGAVAPANGAAPNNGAPTASFSYTPGAGDPGTEASWEVKLYGGPCDPVTGLPLNGAGLMFDSGLHQADLLNSVQLLTAGFLESGARYTMVITAASTTPAMAGSKSTALSVTTFTPNYAVQNPPTSLALTPNANLAALAATWGAPGGQSYYRLYYRLSSVGGALPGPWQLYADQIAATATSISNLMDRLPIGVSLDWAVSAVGANSAESTIYDVLANVGFDIVSGALGTLFLSIGSDAGNTGDLSAWSQVVGVFSIAAHLVTVPTTANALILAAHPDTWDVGNPTNVRVTWTTGCSIGAIAHSNGANNWVRARIDGANLHLDKNVNGTVTTDVVASVAAALTTGNSYWFSWTVTGTTFTCKVSNDSAGAIGTQVATIGGTITDGALQYGQFGVMQCAATSFTFGGNFAGVFQISGPVPVGYVFTRNVGEPAFCWSPFNNRGLSGNGPFAVSIYNASATHDGSWVSTAAPANASYVITGAIRTSGALTAAYFEFVGQANSNTGTGAPPNDSTWHYASSASVPSGGAAFACRARGVGTAYFDDAQLALKQVTLSLAGGADAIIHQAGNGPNVFATLTMQGGPQPEAMLDVAFHEVLGGLAPKYRSGVYDYHVLKIEAPVVQGYANLQALLAAWMAGNTCYYRDNSGIAMAVAPKEKQSFRFIGQQIALGHRRIELELVQVPDAFTPSTTQPAQALGYLQQTQGSVKPLSAAQLAL